MHLKMSSTKCREVFWVSPCWNGRKQRVKWHIYEFLPAQVCCSWRRKCRLCYLNIPGEIRFKVIIWKDTDKLWTYANEEICCMAHYGITRVPLLVSVDLFTQTFFDRIDGWVQERRNSIANALELCPSCNKHRHDIISRRVLSTGRAIM